MPWPHEPTFAWRARSPSLHVRPICRRALVGWSSALGRDGNYGVLVEFLHTGVRSQEHGLFTSGMTSGGRTAGAPLGPDATSIYVSPRFSLRRNALTMSPWAEYVRIGSDVYDLPDCCAISRRSSGPVETTGESDCALWEYFGQECRFKQRISWSMSKTRRSNPTGATTPVCLCQLCG